MDLVLRIVGFVALLLLLGLAALVAFLWWHWRKIRKIAGSGLPPASIDLIADTEAGWIDRRPCEAAVREFERHGFVRSGPFEIVGLPGVRLLGFSHPGERLRACCYQHPAAGCFVDLVATLADGLEITVTNASTGSEMDTRPGTEKLYLAGRAVPELLDALRAKIAGRALRPTAPGSFKEDFIEAYARDMAWRTGRLGVSEAEFRRVSANEERTYTEEQIRAAFRETKRQELHQWAEGVAETFAETTELSVAVWKKFEDALVVFRPDFHPPAYLDYLGQIVDLPESDRAALEAEVEGGMALEQLLARVSGATGHRFVRLGEVERPLRCEVFGLEREPER